MSHFTKLQTQIKDLSILKDACEALGHELVIEPGLKARGYNASQPVDAMIPGNNYDIGFKKADSMIGEETYEIIADWWGIERDMGQNSDVFMKRLNGSYAKQATMKAAKANRWSLASEEDTGEVITLKYRKFG